MSAFPAVATLRLALGLGERTAGQRPESVRIDRQRVFILPSGRGLAFAATLLAMLVGAINYGSNLAHLLVFLLGGMGLVAAVHAHRNLCGLAVRAGRSAPVHAGGEAVFRVCLDNPSGLARQAVALEYRGRAGPRRRPPWQRVLAAVGPEEGACLELRMPAVRRGRLRPGPLRLASGFPLGLFRCWAPFELDLACLVYPQPAGALPLPEAAAGKAAGDGRGEGDEDYSGLRDYARGDPPRRIHWRAAARGDALPVKLFAQGREPDLVLTWDQTGGGGTETRISQLTRWILDTERRGLRYALEIPGRRLAAGRGPQHLQACLEALALFGVADA